MCIRDRDTSPAGINDFIDNNIQYYGGGINQWGESGSYEGADLMRLLNSGYENESVNNSLYWNRGNGTCYNDSNNTTTSCNFTSTGLTETAKEMIEDAKWYTSSSYFDNTASESYIEERKSTTTDFSNKDGVTRTTNWIGKIGLMYPSDYGYASRECFNDVVFYDGINLYDYRQEKCRSTNWLYNGKGQWTITLLDVNQFNVRAVQGTVQGNGVLSSCLLYTS